ncbi:predicted protein [Lichtheimia corymbifera JMRC:FSU:9682]|uniref:Uncharacterized protein n=1 Tax=Lichtheimia corymbifera JMRC:FSU:9682 TaxID=1263082 RepID=A0A068SD18_9FUNG|nr:predicted protein [Lichtheimia corymbifera JMRC:FSU:9682]
MTPIYQWIIFSTIRLSFFAITKIRRILSHASRLLTSSFLYPLVADAFKTRVGVSLYTCTFIVVVAIVILDPCDKYGYKMHVLKRGRTEEI